MAVIDRSFTYYNQLVNFYTFNYCSVQNIPQYVNDFSIFLFLNPPRVNMIYYSLLLSLHFHPSLKHLHEQLHEHR